jgi:putative transcriptional regulator
MSTNHHPDDATLLSYAAGSLAESFQILVSCHLQNCQSCRERITEAEQLGASLMEAVTPSPISQRESFMVLLDQEQDNISYLKEQNDKASIPTDLPMELEHLLQKGDINLPWKRVAPGIESIELSSQDGGLKLLKIAPQTQIPAHSHKGSELTLILQGSYVDELGCFATGDVADLDPSVNHKPKAGADQPCICLVAMDAPLKFNGLLPKLLRPFIHF